MYRLIIPCLLLLLAACSASPTAPSPTSAPPPTSAALPATAPSTTGAPHLSAESTLLDLIAGEKIDEVVFAYSDVSHDYVMHHAEATIAAGADFTLLGAERKWVTLLPVQAAPALPDAADGVVLGCWNPADETLDAAAVVVFDENGAQIFRRDPARPLTCPLQPPACNDNRECR